MKEKVLLFDGYLHGFLCDHRQSTRLKHLWISVKFHNAIAEDILNYRK
jgi:hypothetical protein